MTVQNNQAGQRSQISEQLIRVARTTVRHTSTSLMTILVCLAQKTSNVSSEPQQKLLAVAGSVNKATPDHKSIQCESITQLDK
jgi:hypothetical protein